MHRSCFILSCNFWQRSCQLGGSSGLSIPVRVDPAEGVSTADVEGAPMQEDVRTGGVAADMEETEVGPFELLEEAEPIPHHGRVIARHLEARPVQVQLQQQLANHVQDAFQKQILQNLPFCTLHVCFEYIHLDWVDGSFG